MEDFEEIRSPDVHTMSKEEENTADTFTSVVAVPEPFEEVPAPPAPCGRETTPVFPLKQALNSAALDPSRVYEMQDRRAAKTTTGSFTVKHEELFYNVMAVGGSGLGKTTLLRNLFQGYAGEVQLPTPGRRSYATIDDFVRNPDSYIWAPFRVIDESTCKSVQVKVVDVPGHGFEVDMPHKEYVRKLLAFVLQQKAKDYETYTSKVFQADIMGKLRSTLSVCLYFLSPFTMRPLDLVLMAALSKEVPVVPVIAMSDTMSPGKRHDYSQHIMSQLLNPQRMLPNWGTSGPVDVVTVTKEDKDKLGVAESRVLPPFAVMGSEDLAAEEEDNSSYCPVIHTMAGSLEVMNRHFCDTILLKRFLMGDSCDGFWNILSAATNRYLSFCERVETMSEKRMDKKLAKMAEEISVLCQCGDVEFGSTLSPARPSPAPPAVNVLSSAATSSAVNKPASSSTSPRRNPRSSPRSQPLKHSSCVRVWKGMRPALQMAFMLLLVFGAFLAGTNFATRHDAEHVHAGARVGSQTVPELGVECPSTLQLLSSSSSALDRTLDNEASTPTSAAAATVTRGDKTKTRSGTSASSSLPPASSAHTPTPKQHIPLAIKPGSQPKFSAEVADQPSQPTAANTSKLNNHTPGNTLQGDNFFSTLTSSISNTVQLPDSRWVKAWTQDTLDWLNKVRQKRPRVVKRSRLLAFKAASAVMKQLEVATQTLKCKIGGQAGGTECAQ